MWKLAWKPSRGRSAGAGARSASWSEIVSWISKLDDGKHVYYLDIGGKFLQPDGSISKDIMPDFLHLSAAGYQIWADAVETKLAELMK